MLSQEGLDNGVIMCGDGNLWSVANLTDNPTAAVVMASCMPLNVLLKHCNEVSIVSCCSPSAVFILRHVLECCIFCTNEHSVWVKRNILYMYCRWYLLG